MRRCLCVISVVLAFVPGGAWAADANWSGLYAGLGAGFGWSSGKWTNQTSTPAGAFFDYVPGQGFSDNQSGPLGVAQIGFNIQNGPWVFGAEAMVAGADISGKFKSNVTSGAADDEFEARLDALVLGTVRVGYAWDNLLAYGKAGYGMAHIHVSVSDVTLPTTGSGNASQWRSGPTFGLGLEYRLTQQLSIAAEYDYLHLESGDYDLGGGAGSYVWDVGIRDVNMLLVRMNYRFALNY
jgi:outer membrane immunogenic protein